MPTAHRKTLTFGPDDQGVALIVRQTHREDEVLATVWKRDGTELGGWWMVSQRHLDASVPAAGTDAWDQVLQTLYNAAGSVSEWMTAPF